MRETLIEKLNSARESIVEQTAELESETVRESDQLGLLLTAESVALTAESAALTAECC